MSEQKQSYAHVGLPGLKELFNQPPLIPRAEVQWFAYRMEAKLRENDHKPHWSKGHKEYFMHRLYEEMDELWRALEKESAEDIINEAADVANFAMMIADNAEKWVREGEA